MSDRGSNKLSDMGDGPCVQVSAAAVIVRRPWKQGLQWGLEQYGVCCPWHGPCSLRTVLTSCLACRLPSPASPLQVYPTRPPKVALHCLSLGVRPEERFGFLGANGAGGGTGEGKTQRGGQDAGSTGSRLLYCHDERLGSRHVQGSVRLGLELHLPHWHDLTRYLLTHTHPTPASQARARPCPSCAASSCPAGAGRWWLGMTWLRSPWRPWPGRGTARR